MSNKEQIAEIELNIEQAKEIVSLGDALERLMVNPDFIRVITEGYFEKEAVRLVHLKGDLNLQDEESQRSILTQMDAISGLTGYLNKVRHQAYSARAAIEADEETRQELIAEGLE